MGYMRAIAKIAFRTQFPRSDFKKARARSEEAYHVSLSRRRSPVRIRSGPPSKKHLLVGRCFLLGQTSSAMRTARRVGSVEHSHAQVLAPSMAMRKSVRVANVRYPVGRAIKLMHAKILLLW